MPAASGGVEFVARFVASVPLAVEGRQCARGAASRDVVAGVDRAERALGARESRIAATSNATLQVCCMEQEQASMRDEAIVLNRTAWSV